MSRFGLIAAVAMIVMIVPLFAPIARAVGQPPIVTNTFWEGTAGWGPRRADTVRAYDTASGELIFNCYENLIAWNKELYYDFVPQLATNVPTRLLSTLTVSNTSAVDVTEPSGSTWTDGIVVYTLKGWFDCNVSDSMLFGPGDVVYLWDGAKERAWYVKDIRDNVIMDLEGYSYVFNVRTSPIIDFFNETGDVVDTLDVDDVKYSFDRGLVQDQAGSPMWMFYKAFFGTMDNTNWDKDTAMDLAYLIDSAVEINASSNEVRLNLAIPFPDNAFKQVLSSTWAAINSREFSINIGCWNGDLFTNSTGGTVPDWWYNVKGKTRSPYDGTGANVGYRFCGTGPYRVTTFDAAGFKVIMQRNPGYWGGWPASGCNGSLDTVEIDYIADWTTRKSKFLNGEIDTCYVPRANIFELLDPVTRQPPPGVNYKTIKNLYPSLTLDAMHFTFTLDSSSPYVGTGHFPDGIPLDFFNNTHVRKAFAYSFNHTQAIRDIWFGEASYVSFTPLIVGLYPDYHTISSGYDVSFASAEAELKNALFDGQRVWDTGFTLTLGYYVGDVGRISLLMIREFFIDLSTYDGRTGPLFTVNIVDIDWPTYITYFESFKLPIFDIGWYPDFADADNFVRPYMRSDGEFSEFQNYTLANGWAGTHGTNFPSLNKDQLIDLAFVTSDGPERMKTYADLESVYMADCPSSVREIPMSRRWCQYWVKGWYYDAMYPSAYFYSTWKQDDCWFDTTGPTVGVSDGVVNMRDIVYLIMHFNAKAPIPGKTVDPKWVGVYGANGCVDPDSDRLSGMRDIQGTILHFSHRQNTTTP